jgi:hypothetical protein
MFNMYAHTIEPLGYKTEAAGTAIFKLVDPVEGFRTVIKRVTVLTGATAHALVVMRPFKKVVTTAEAAAAQKVIAISEDPGSIAANDYCVVRLKDGTYQLNKVASVNTLEITFTDNWTAIVEEGAPVWFMGAVGDAHASYVLAANTENNFESEGGQFIGNGAGSPMVLYIANATNASIIQGGVVVHVQG